MASLIYSLLLSSILFTLSSYAASDNGGFTLDLLHRDPPSGEARFRSIRSAIDRSFSRKSYLLSKLNKGIESVDATITGANGEYVMKFLIGTPPVEQLGIADTGSDLLWTQCLPCTQCYKQDSPLFNPSKSRTFRPISCQSDLCQAAGSASCDDGNHCQYQVSYGDRSHTAGDVGTETISFGGKINFPKVAFGCGHDNDGTFSQAGSGIVGLGGGAVSIVNQLRSTTGGRFSYCLTLLNANASSKISFGSDAVVSGSDVISTPLVKKSPDTFYYLTLEGFSVGDKRTEIGSSKAGFGGSVEEGNIIIDSGTTLTFVPQEFYDGVEAALVEAIDAQRTSDPQGTFGLCYRVSGGQGIESPPLTVHFTGADVVVEAVSLFVEVSEGLVCLTLVPSQELAIYGNLFQMNYHVGYDLVKGEVSFQKTDCAAQEE
ncbi:aspartic proteinase CDR1-like [Salvia hispanica]|uniref:aspartic proteinase CDR1-like n=1 Tax=Salvia hispanica TaxID=49212 RepID=UPI00200922DB|nr:aspartic proteinase CDR1-like [Salvia hispanica]